MEDGEIMAMGERVCRFLKKTIENFWNIELLGDEVVV
jgi:hypothetical protein